MKVEVRLEAKGNRDRQGLLYKSIGKFAWWLLENWQIFKVREGGGNSSDPRDHPTNKCNEQKNNTGNNNNKESGENYKASRPTANSWSSVIGTSTSVMRSRPPPLWKVQLRGEKKIICVLFKLSANFFVQLFTVSS